MKPDIFEAVQEAIHVASCGLVSFQKAGFEQGGEKCSEPHGSDDYKVAV